MTTEYDAARLEECMYAHLHAPNHAHEAINLRWKQRSQSSRAHRLMYEGVSRKQG